MEYRVPPYVTVLKRAFVRVDVRRIVAHAAVTEIADGACWDWAGLEEVVFEPGSLLERIGDHAFAGAALKKFVAPDGLMTIEAGAFAGCKSLKEVRLNEGLESLGDGVFQDSGVEVVYLPSTLQRLGKETFAGCESIRRIEVVEGCRPEVRRCLPQTAEIVAVSTQSQLPEGAKQDAA